MLFSEGFHCRMGGVECERNLSTPYINTQTPYIGNIYWQEGREEGRREKEQIKRPYVTQSLVYLVQPLSLSLLLNSPFSCFSQSLLTSLSSNLTSPPLYFFASSFLPSSFLTPCPLFKVGPTLGVLNLQPCLHLPLSALTVNLGEKWRWWHITGMINSC